ncbi:MAG: septal ring lytic transglycosylase RlpA family protein [Ignavibacteria bacterium]
MGKASLVAAALAVAACGTPVVRPVERAETPTTAPAKPAPQKPAWVLKKGGGYYQDDGPGDNPPADIDAIPDAVPRAEPPHRFANNPYSVLGRDYVPLKPGTPYRASGVASWYGRKFNGQKTSSGEVYDMYGMTAAHATLPIPSYARVTNPANGKSVVVRVNDRGPFHAGRIIDLSYTAAWKLGYVGNGSTSVLVESIQPGQEAPVTQARAGDDPLERLATAAEPPAKPLPEVADARGHYLQLGAFGNRDNAEALKARLARELGSLGDKLVVQAAGKVFRLQLGPWADAREARAVGERLREVLDAAPVLVQR